MSWRTIALRDRARTEQNAPLKTILTSALAPQGSRAQHVPKTSRNVQQPNPACMDNASTHMDRMRKYIVIVMYYILFSKTSYYLCPWSHRCDTEYTARVMRFTNGFGNKILGTVGSNVVYVPAHGTCIVNII